MRGSVLFLDSNFTENHPPEGELFNLLWQRRISFYAGGSLKLAEDPRRVALAAKKGLRGLLVGFESIVPGSVNGTGKIFNRPAAYRDAIRVLHDNGIKILGCFVFGFDGDDESVFERTCRFVEKNHIDIVRYAIATPLPGTALYRSLAAQGRILERDWELYDTDHVVFRPALMPPERLQEGLRQAYRGTYSFFSAFKRLAGSAVLAAFHPGQYGLPVPGVYVRFGAEHMKIVLILPRAGIYRFGTGAFSRFIRYSPMTLTTLASLVPEELGAEIELYDEGVERVPYRQISADIVGVTGITGASRRSYAYADYFRARGLYVVIGGVHATLMPEEAQQHADTVIRGQAFESWPRFLRDWAAGAPRRGRAGGEHRLHRVHNPVTRIHEAQAVRHDKQHPGGLRLPECLRVPA